MKKIIVLIVVVLISAISTTHCYAHTSGLKDFQKGMYFRDRLKQISLPRSNQYMSVRYNLFKEEIYYFKKAVHAGYIPADYYLSKLYYEGDENEIIYWQDNNGDYCATDQGASGRKKEYYLKKAAHAGYIPAELNLALYYDRGIISYRGIHNISCLHTPPPLVMKPSIVKAVYWDTKVLKQGGKKYCTRVIIVNSSLFKNMIVKYCGISSWNKNYK